MKYILKHRERSAAVIQLNEDATKLKLLEVMDPDHLPVGVVNSNGNVSEDVLQRWWCGRAIPASRAGIDLILEELQLHTPQALSLKCFGLSLSDQYWICPENEPLCWHEINFFDHPFSEEVGNILLGTPISHPGPAVSLKSPDNTSDGWLRKKWCIADGKRILLKAGSGGFRQEPYNEVIASAIARQLGIPCVDYQATVISGEPYSVCEDFITRDLELVSAAYIRQGFKAARQESSIRQFISCAESRGIPDVSLRLDQMLTLDFLIANEDRHFNNFGAVRNTDTLEWLGMAPVFDSGTSLWYNTPDSLISSMKAHPSKPFKRTHEEQIQLVKSFDWLDVCTLHALDELAEDILLDAIYISDARRNIICGEIAKRVKLLKEIMEKRKTEA